MARIDVSATSTIQGVHLAIFPFVSALRVRPTWSTRYSSAIFIPQQDPLFDDQGFFCLFPKYNIISILLWLQCYTAAGRPLPLTRRRRELTVRLSKSSYDVNPLHPLR